MEEQKDSDRRKGNEAFVAGEYGEAIDWYSKAIEAQEKDVAICFSNRSACWLKLAEPSKALLDAIQAISTDQTLVKAYYRAGEALSSMGMPHEAFLIVSRGLKACGRNAALAGLARKCHTAAAALQDSFRKGEELAAAVHREKEAMFHASNKNYPSVLKFLSEGFHPNRRCNSGIKTKQGVTMLEGATLLHAASQSGDERTVDAVLQAGGNANLMTNSGETPLALAIAHGHEGIAKLLLDHGAMVELTPFQDKEKNSYLHLACRHGLLDTLQVLLAKGASPSATNAAGETPLMAAIRGKASCALKHDMCVALLDAGCPLESVAKVVQANGKSHAVNPLMAAVMSQCAPVVKLLLTRGAKADVVTTLDLTPLGMACLNGSVLCAQALLESGGADANALFPGKERPLHIATANRSLSVDMVALLLKHGANPNAVNSKQCYPISYAVMLGAVQCAKALLSAGADANITSQEGLTLLEIATQRGDHSMVHELLPFLTSNEPSVIKRCILHSITQQSRVFDELAVAGWVTSLHYCDKRVMAILGAWKTMLAARTAGVAMDNNAPSKERLQELFGLVILGGLPFENFVEVFVPEAKHSSQPSREETCREALMRTWELELLQPLLPGLWCLKLRKLLKQQRATVHQHIPKTPLGHPSRNKQRLIIQRLATTSSNVFAKFSSMVNSPVVCALAVFLPEPQLAPLKQLPKLKV